MNDKTIEEFKAWNHISNDEAYDYRDDEQAKLLAWQHQQKRIDELELKIGKLECLEHDDELIVETIKSLQAKIDALEHEQERANLLEVKLAIAVEALELYSNLKGMTFAGGGRATEALNKIRKIGE